MKLLQQLPASLLYKCVDGSEVYANEACFKLFGLGSAREAFLETLAFYDPESKHELTEDSHPFNKCAKEGTINLHVRITSTAKNLNCVVSGTVIYSENQQWIVLNLTSAQDNDISQLAFAKNSPLDNHLAFNRLLSKISSQLINLNSENLDCLIEKKLGAFGEFSGVDRCYIFQFYNDGNLMDNTHEWVAPGITPHKEELKGLSADDLPYFHQVIKSEQIFKVDDVEQLPEVATLEKQEFQREGIGAVLCVAIYLNEKLFGFIGCDIVGSAFSWREHDVRYLKLIGEIVSNTLAAMSNKQSLEQVSAELAAANKQLDHLANSDGLTGIANRRQFDNTLDSAIRRGIRDSDLLSLLFIDVDLFKQFNDTYGHSAGDEALKLVAKTLHECCRRFDDLAARYGGEEFAVILPQTDAKQAHYIAELIQLKLEELAIPFDGSPGNKILSVSIGIATQACTIALTSGQLVGMADKALYQAKAKGRNRIEVYQ
ncbi:sensor domain-containing diguanylate cyclase [Alteromonas ponticola]|uniref:diguanylate cyclase n=1 Tax=Alteromonas ponticola TaxID=2720613 RepID=A0ABX1R5T3_9ALTE|nr:diguanylate cyclase [Alteromonas ponticola]NMH61163.1 diguanylate cyclase [Alteromonas ponticola]